MTEPVLAARDVVVSFNARQRPAVDGANLEVLSGEAIGVVGESGSGKTTLARVLVGTLAASSGTVTVLGRQWSAVGHHDPIRRKAQMIFQDAYASLNPRMTARQTVAEVLKIWTSISRRRADESAAERLAEVGLAGAVIDRHPGGLSGGQCQRVGIARALATDPEILIADEPTSSLDVSVQAGILNMLVELRQTRGLTLVFISHDLSVVRYITDRACVMYRGHIVESGPTPRLFTQPSHPYTRCLVESIPGSGGVPQLARNILPSDRGCVYAKRCPRLGDGCDNRPPDLIELEAGHGVACHYPISLTEIGRKVDGG